MEVKKTAKQKNSNSDKVTLKITGTAPFVKNITITKDEYITLLESRPECSDDLASQLAKHLGVPEEKVMKLELSEIARGDEVILGG